ncbi:MAG TPA: hypothetical protein VHW23_16115 [Kofleriaceae bacterium]|jgi:hypothetical protein|nr:hypothetical protein [Kofleriaceae bacterium]
MTELLPDGAFRAVLSLLTGGLAGTWMIHDILFLARVARHRGARRRDPLAADQMFGYMIGIVIGVIGLVGTLRFNGIF